MMTDTVVLLLILLSCGFTSALGLSVDEELLFRSSFTSFFTALFSYTGDSLANRSFFFSVHWFWAAKRSADVMSSTSLSRDSRDVRVTSSCFPIAVGGRSITRSGAIRFRVSMRDVVRFW
uniref:Putative secreted peptide n=1 Tax=Anopheles braziliensis TaxID=58242 RepID=A0A2M3ZU41_9DIPT